MIVDAEVSVNEYSSTDGGDLKGIDIGTVWNKKICMYNTASYKTTNV